MLSYPVAHPGDVMAHKILLLVLFAVTLGLACFIIFTLQRSRRLYWERYFLFKGRIMPPLLSLWFGERVRAARRSASRKRPKFFFWWIRKNVLILTCALGAYVMVVGGAIYTKRIFWPQPVATHRLADAVAVPEEYKKLRRTYIELSAAVEKHPGDVPLLLQLAQTQRDMGSLRPAMQTYRKVLMVHPNSPEGLYGLGALAAAVGEVNLATLKANELAQLRPNKPESHLILAQLALRAGNKKLSADQLRAALEKDPANLEARELLVTLSLMQKSYVVAVREAEAGMKFAPASTTMPLLLARGLAGAGRSSEALALLRSVSTKQPTAAAPFLLMAELQVQRGEFVPAIVTYEEVLKRTPNDMASMNNIALLIADHGYELERASALAAELYTKNPKNPGVIDTMGWVLFKQGKQEQALALLQMAAAGAPKNPVHRYHYGVALLKGGDVTVGRRELAEALKLSGTFDGAAQAKALLARKR
jgi:Flp pilus assembly protein TadD